MKCPNCGQWNRAAMPRCSRCGENLPTDAPQEYAWKSNLRDDRHGKAYIRMDADGNPIETPDSRDSLAEEMAELKKRKSEGSRQQRRMRQVNIRQKDGPASPKVRMHTQAESFWTGTAEDPRETIRVRRSEAGRRGSSRTVVHHVDDAPKAWDEDILAYDRGWQEQQELAATGWQLPEDDEFSGRLPSRSRDARRLTRALLILFLLMLTGLCVFFGYHYFINRAPSDQFGNGASVVASIKDDLAAHTILIPGEEGASVYIRELHTAYVVTGGFATIEVADHTWYDTMVELPSGSLPITLTPFLKTDAGQQKPLEPITFEIDIPDSPITMNTPEALRTEVSASMYTMSFTVRPGSTVFINDRNVSDTIDANGQFSYNATVQAIGDNQFRVRVRSQYCRESQLNVVLYREVQEIPLDLAPDTYTSTNNKAMLVNVTTLPGATVNVASPFTDLDITNLDTTGAFSFYAVFDKYGYNTIKITSSLPGRKTSTIEYQVYYVPNQDDYTPKAWPLTSAGYAELISNTATRAERQQIYVVMGTVAEIVSEKPQMVIINASGDGKSQPVLVQNFSSTPWELGEYYRIYADVYGTYSNMPWLYGRYTYRK